jgi:signal recognition particle subunit SRP72
MPTPQLINDPNTLIQLEQDYQLMTKRHTKEEEREGVEVNKKIEKKKKKRVRLPKNYDPSVLPDPERWLPKQERKGYKKIRGKKGRVTQGGEAANQDTIAKLNQASTVNQDVSNSNALKKKKNKKRK